MAGSTAVIGDAPAGRGRPRAAVLVGAVAALLATALAVTGVLLWRERRDAGPAAVVDVVERYTRAWNGHDADAVLAAMSFRGTFSAGENLRTPLVGPLRGPALTDLLRRAFAAGVSVRTTGPVAVTGDGPWQVTVTQEFDYDVRGIAVRERAVSLFTVVEGGRGEGLRIEEHVFWRPYHGTNPSLLWAAAAPGVEKVAQSLRPGGGGPVAVQGGRRLHPGRTV